METNSTRRHFARRCRAFTMVEMLVVISVIAVMAALVISAFSNASQDARRVVARQQQAAVQNAINAWISSQSSSGGGSLSSARSAYNTAPKSLDKLELVGGYLDDSTLEHFQLNTSDDAQVQSSALKKTSQFLDLPDWDATGYPTVDLKNVP